MSDVAIVCEGLGKQYRIGERERYKALRDVLTDAATAPLRLLRRGLRAGNGAATEAKPTIWALQDVSFEIKTLQSSNGLCDLAKNSSQPPVPRLGYSLMKTWKSSVH